ncbi:MAG TPA: FtsX-like permease family protein, partial [Thermoanaerobaculia bacterium]|nr:FtsX-like permease family protein [Thermoanaerobaculia bacterium]
RREARQLLAADLAIEGRRPLPPDFDLARAGLADVRRTDITELVTVAAAPPRGSAPGPSQLVELKAIRGDYPFYGVLELRPDRPLAALLRADTVVVAAELLSRLGLRVGDELRIGGQPFRIAGVVVSEPDRVSVSLTLGPRVFISADGLARTALIQRGSRVGYRTLLKLPAGFPGAGVEPAAERLRLALPDTTFYEVESYRAAQPELRDNLSRVERYLGLVALLSLFVGGIGVAQSVRAWLASRLDAIAVLKCLGLRPREIFPLYLGQTALLGLAGSVVGIVAGAAVQLALPSLFPDLIPAELIRPWQPASLLRGLGLGLGVALLFSLPPLSAVLRVPPARVLRRDAEPLPRHRWAAAVTGVALVAGVWGMATLQSRSWDLGARFTGGVALVTVVLAAAALLVSRGAQRIPRDLSPSWARLWLRHGLAALARPGAGTVGAIVAMGLGVLVVLGMSLVERRLSRELSTAIPENAPSAFLVDIQPAQWPGIEGVLRQAGATRIDSVAVVMARLSAIDGKGIEDLAAPEPAPAEEAGTQTNNRPDERARQGRGRRRGGEDGARRWALTREQRLTYMKELPADNEIVAGALWSDPARAEVSVEKDYADDLDLKLGSVLRFDIQGVPVEVTVTSLRTVDWGTFGINFFLVVEPGVLEEAPQQRLTAVLLPRGAEQRVQDEIAANYPNVTMLRIREILEKVLGVMKRIGLAIRFLGAFTVLAGIAILAGAISAGSARRGREVALLKTLGMTRRGVAATFAVEYALIGLVAGVIGALGAAVLARGVVTQGFELTWQAEPGPVTLAILASVVLTVAAGLAASFRALERRPIEVLRSE